MAKILQCPSCHSTMDVTDVDPGSSVECPDCAQTLQVPARNTSIRTKTVSAPIPAAPSRPASSPAVRSGSSPRLTRPAGRSRSGTMPLPPQPAKSHGGLWIGLGIGALGIVVVVILFMMREQHQQEEGPRAKAPPAPKGPSTVTFNPTLPAGSDKPITIGEGAKSDVKPTTLARPAETVDNVNWAQLMQQLRPGGGFDNLDRPEGVAFQRVKSFGPPAYPKLISFIDDEDTAIGTAAVAVLNSLTGRDEPLPKGVNKGKIKAEWEEWLKNSTGTAKPDAPKKP
jgi:hypothetical protein